MRFQYSPFKSERAGPSVQSAHEAAADPVGMDYGSAARALHRMPPSITLTIRGLTSMRWRTLTTVGRVLGRVLGRTARP
ncbi:hypothetical protein CHELA41_24343 [Hyphomicrobiales bacterium]|nr:hypothetical protein CHELA41_24343 [Hyphomicrobiales bacterium]